MIPFFLFLFGLIIGSFLNAVIYRLRLDESFVRGRSRCLHCRHTLQWYDLVPVGSWLELRGRCRYCHKPISWQYPLVEIATGLAFILIFQVFPLTDQMLFLRGLATALMTCLLIIIFVYDWRHYIIPDAVVWPLAIIAAMSSLLWGQSWTHLLLAATVGGGFFLLQYLISQGRWIGFGDVKLGLAMGLMVGWPLICAALMLAYISGSIIGVSLIVFGRKHMSSQIPFGTFLSLASFVVLLYGVELWNWYQHLILFS